MSDTGCTCATCVRACSHIPGWFRPGEVEQTAALLGITVPELFARYLTVDFMDAEAAIFGLRPATVKETPGHLSPFNPFGARCVFLRDDRCAIHTAKPFECRTFNPCEHGASKGEHIETMQSWCNDQAQVTALLGGEPIAPMNDGSIGPFMLGSRVDDYDYD